MEGNIICFIATIALLVCIILAAGVCVFAYTIIWWLQIKWDFQYMGGLYTDLYYRVYTSFILQCIALGLSILTPGFNQIKPKDTSTSVGVAGGFFTLASIGVGIASIVYVAETIYSSSVDHCTLMYSSIPNNLTVSQQTNFNKWCASQTSGMTAAQNASWWESLDSNRCHGFQNKIIIPFAIEYGVAIIFALVIPIIAFRLMRSMTTVGSE